MAVASVALARAEKRATEAVRKHVGKQYVKVRTKHIGPGWWMVKATFPTAGGERVFRVQDAPGGPARVRDEHERGAFADAQTYGQAPTRRETAGWNGGRF